MFGQGAKWLVAAQELGLVLHERIEGAASYLGGASFSQVKRMIGPAAAPPPDTLHWMVGNRRTRDARGASRDVEVVVLVNIVSHGSSSTTYTHTIARVDPPLFTGLSLVRSSWLGRTFGTPPRTFGEHALDHALRLEARDAARAALLFTGRGGPSPRLGDRLLPLTNVDFQITDGVVDLYTSNGIVTDPVALAWRLDTAASLATGLADQDAWLPPDPNRASYLGILGAFASAAGFTLDERRVRVNGVVAGAQVRITLESQPGAIYTTVSVELPQNLGLGLRMKPQGSLQFIADFFGGQDIIVGDRMFDDRFVIQGNVPDFVRRAFASAPLRQAVLELAHGAVDVRVDDARLFFRYPIPVTREDQLFGIAARIDTAVNGFFPRGAGVGPYR